MPKPTLQEYQEAVQKPAICFNDIELSKGTPVPGILGLPKVISGGFAGVFPIKCNNITYAVRCFLKDVQDNEERYEIIGKYLDSIKLQYMVTFQYIEKGILVRGTWYPIVKMKWVEGDTLGSYLEKNHTDSEKIQSIITKFQKMVSVLKESQISHCDLHHSNILVINDELVLIDYDAMFVPGLHGKTCNEVGHRNFQHPERNILDFGIFVDNFSEWVILLSLLAIQKKPEIWEITDAGDECLIFRENDFRDFTSSNVLTCLSEIKDDNFQRFLLFFKDVLLSADVDNIPSILEANNVLSQYSDISQIIFTPGAHITKRSFESITITDPSWIWENQTIEYKNFQNATSLEHKSVYALIISIFGFNSVFAYLEFSGVFLLISLLTMTSTFTSLMIYNYRRNPVIAEKELLINEKIKQDSIVDALYKEIEQVNEDNKKIYEDTSSKIDKINQNIKELQIKKQIIIKDQEKLIRNKLNEVIREKRNLQRDETEEIRTQLKTIQGKFIEERLSRHRIRNAKINGVGATRARDLELNGIRTAADFTGVSINYYYSPNGELYFILKNRGSIRVNGIGPKIGKNIDHWREMCRQRYVGMMPNNLNTAEFNRIKNKYNNKKIELDDKEIQYKKELKIISERVKNQTKTDESRYKGDIKLQNDYYISVSEKLKEKIIGLNEKLEKELWEKNRIEHQLKGYQKLTFKKYISQIFTSTFNHLKGKNYKKIK